MHFSLFDLLFLYACLSSVLVLLEYTYCNLILVVLFVHTQCIMFQWDREVKKVLEHNEETGW